MYEVYNKETGVVEGSSQVLPAAIRACRIYAQQLKEELELTQPIDWNIEEIEDDQVADS